MSTVLVELSGQECERSGLGTGENSAENSSLSRVLNSEREGVIAAELSLRITMFDTMVNGILKFHFQILCS